MRDAQGLSQRLQFAMAIRDTYRTDVIAFSQQQFDGHPAVEFDLGRGCLDGHSILNWSGASGQKPICTGQFHYANAA
jgi:hypothetical protein